MAKNVFSTKEFNTIVKGAKVELSGVFSSPFVVCNLLNKAAKGDFAKVAGVEGITRENLAKVAGVLKGMHDGRYAFDVCVFQRNSKGQICTIEKAKKCPKFGMELVDVNTAGFVYLKPVHLTINGVFNAFAKVAKVDVRANEKAAKDSAKAAKVAAKAKAELEKAKAAFVAAFGNDYVCTLSDVEIVNRYKAIKAA